MTGHRFALWALSWIATCILIACIFGCGAAIDGEPECERSEYELEVHYRCTSSSELQTLDCGEWVTVAVCIAYGGAPDPGACTPGPVPGCN